MINGLPLPAMFIAPDKRCIKANRLAKHLFPQWRKGRELSSVINDDDVQEIVRLAIDDGGIHECTIHLGDRPKRIYRVQVNGKVRRNKKRRILIVFYDITEQQELNEIRAAFVANVSHELRSPLTTLLGAVQAVDGMQDRNSDTASRFLEIMQAEAERMRILVNDLLMLSSAESKERLLPEDTVSIGPIILQVIDGLKLKAESRNIDLDVDIYASLPNVLADEQEMVQAITNLVDNAIKYSRRGTKVSVKAELVGASSHFSGGGVSVTFHNWGSVIPFDKIPRLTERFYRLDDSRSREMGGTGLGLAIVKHIMSRHQGELMIDSSEENGTKFTIFMPLNDQRGDL